MKTTKFETILEENYYCTVLNICNTIFFLSIYNTIFFIYIYNTYKVYITILLINFI
jgi:hypothetical protein